MAYNYIIASDDAEAALEKTDEIRQSVSFAPDCLDYDLEEDGIYSLIDELTTVSLFNTPKLITVKSAEELAICSEKAFTELLKAMNDVNSDNILILLFLKSFNPNTERNQRLKRYSSVIDIKMKNIPLDKYIEQALSKDGYTIESQALSLLISYQPDLSSLKGYLEVLKCYKKDDKRITDTDVKQLVPAPLEDNVYQLVEAVLNKDKKRIFSCFKALKLRSVQASYLVSLLINKFQELYNVSVLVRSNTTQADIATLFNVSSGRAYYMIKNAKATNQTVISKNLSLLNDLDYHIKSGGIDQNLGLELYFLN